MLLKRDELLMDVIGLQRHGLRIALYVRPVNGTVGDVRRILRKIETFSLPREGISIY